MSAYDPKRTLTRFSKYRPIVRHALGVGRQSIEAQHGRGNVKVPLFNNAPADASRRTEKEQT